MIKTFFCFPYNAKYKILYTNYKDFNLLLFKSLRNKVTRRNTWRVRLRQFKLIDIIIRKFTKIKIKVPDSNIRLVYYNGKKYVCFQYKGDLPCKVYHINGEGTIIRKENFKGYPIVSKYKVEEVKKDLIFKFLNNHWQKLKMQNRNMIVVDNLHGDLTHFNVLVNESKIQTIDKKSIFNSILFDHFYFYSYLLQAFEDYRSINKDKTIQIKEILDSIYKKIFYNEDKVFLKKALNAINLEDAVGLRSCQRKEKYFNIFYNLILN